MSRLTPILATLVTLCLLSACDGPNFEVKTGNKSEQPEVPAPDYSALEAALNSGDIELARQLLADAKQLNPEAPEIAAYEAQLAELLSEADFQQYLQQARELMAVDYHRLEDDEQDMARSKLLSAHEFIQKARAINKDEQLIKDALGNLEQTYLNMIESSAGDRAYHRAKGFISDSMNTDIDKARIETAKEDLGKAILKKARMLDRM